MNYYKKKINNHYNSLLKKRGLNTKGLGWGNGKLNLRYNIFCRHLNFKNKKVLDFGCGLGSFYKFLSSKKIFPKKFYGIEINQTLINYIKKNYNKKILVSKKIPKKLKVDYCVSNGVHNYKVKGHKKIFYKDLNDLLKVTKICLAISFINDDVDYRENHLSYKSLFELIKFIRKKKCHYLIDQTFNKYETFVFIFKK